MSAHTQGPWTAEPFRSSAESFTIVGPHDSVITHVIRGATTDSEVTAANARLIAASPDLLSALKDLVDVIDRLGTVRLPKMDAARAAIRKATGSAS